VYCPQMNRGRAVCVWGGGGVMGVLSPQGRKQDCRHPQLLALNK
jgi:hypothetical protein